MKNLRRALSVAVALGLSASAASLAPSIDAEVLPGFPHKPHLSAAAVAACATSGGSDTDCRGCHKYEKGARDTHLTGCDECHVDGKHLVVERTKTAPDPRRAFQHEEHLFAKDGSPRRDISCFTCHAMRVADDFIEFTVPNAGLGPRGVGGKGGGSHGEKTCADCHALHETQGGDVPQYAKTGDGKACATCHQTQMSILPLKYRADMRSSAAKSFAHKDHGGAAGDCASCHDGIKSSVTIWDYDPTKGTAEKCATCHVGKDGSLARPAPEPPSPLRNVDFDDFPHAKHMGEFSRMTCATCHYPEKDEQGRRVFPGRVASSEPVGRSALVNYKACDACHGHDGWGPDKKSWHVDGHGVGAWACFKCHEGVADAKGKLAIATAKLPQALGFTFKILEHAHPGVTTRGARLDDATQPVAGGTAQCSDCHLGNLATLESRLRDKPFQHGPHVPTDPKTADCLACHKHADAARRSEDLSRLEGASECRRCHVGMEGAGGIGADGRRTVPQFDHAGHVRSAALVAGEKGIGCVDCHVPGGQFGYQIPDDVLNCTKCHAHEGDAAKVARTGKKTSAPEDAAKCSNCHGPVRGETSGSIRMPRGEAPSREHLELAAGAAQFHDKTGDCASCHARDGLVAAEYEPRICNAKRGRYSLHDDPALEKESFNLPQNKPFEDPDCNCRKCHRFDPRGYLKGLRR